MPIGRTTIGGTPATGLSPATRLFLPSALDGSFRLQPFFPPAEHSTNLDKLFRDLRVFFRINRADVPRQLYQ